METGVLSLGQMPRGQKVTGTHQEEEEVSHDASGERGHTAEVEKATSHPSLDLRRRPGRQTGDREAAK